MIYDHISNLANYKSVSKNIGKFVDYIKQHDITVYEPGVYEIDEDIFFTVKTYEPRLPESAGWETHKKFIDIQYVIEGKELMGVAPSSILTVKEPYNDEQDKMTYLPTDKEATLKLWPGMFALLLPQDAHHPTLIDGEVTLNKKAVVKIRL